MDLFLPENYESCSSDEPLTITKYDPSSKDYVLEVNKNATSYSPKLRCCYSPIKTSEPDISIDHLTAEELKLKLLDKCIPFKNAIRLPTQHEQIMVKCILPGHRTFEYINMHATVPERQSIRKRLNNWKNKKQKRPLSILMIGIDSISRLNFIRAMPKTANYVSKAGWFEMAGYNKIDDNTFPNLMAMFTGYNEESLNQECNPKVLNALDNCPIIWYEFRQNGYVTAYAEDEQRISTFNYLKAGFNKTPTDYYLRPLLLLAENVLPVKTQSGMRICLGYKHAAEYVYDYAQDFAITYKDDPHFGVFWANSFSHNSFSDASLMDDRMLEYFNDLENRGVLDKSIIIFFSDHGSRFGLNRLHASSRFEDRLPLFYISIPEWFQILYPTFVNALEINRNRLTTPYDVYLTLKHILYLSEGGKRTEHAKDSPHAQSLFEIVPEDRSCESVGISIHWCTCLPYEDIDTSSEIAKLIAYLSVEYINNLIKSRSNGMYADLCHELFLGDIIYINRQTPSLSNHSQMEIYQIAFQTMPGEGIFEMTIQYDRSTNEFAGSSDISRLNMYGTFPNCIQDEYLRKICFCKIIDPV